MENIKNAAELLEELIRIRGEYDVMKQEIKNLSYTLMEVVKNQRESQIIVQEAQLIGEDGKPLEVPPIKEKDKKQPKQQKETKLIEVKKLKLGKEVKEVYVYDTFVIVDGKKRKIYEIKKGRLFSYEGKSIYIQFNGAQVV